MKANGRVTAGDVVIPARNAAPYIGAAIQSVLDQSLPASGIIVVDDQSDDGTAAAAAVFGDRVRIVSGEGRGAGAARNLGVCHSDNDLIAFLDADDVCRPDRLKQQSEALRRDRGLAMTFCDAEYADASGTSTGALFMCPDYRGDVFLGQLFERNRILTASVVMMRRAAFDAAGGFDERLSHAEDYDLWLRVAGDGVIGHVDQALLSYRLHDTNLSGNQDALRQCEVRILNKHSVPAIRAALLDCHVDPMRADIALSRVLFRMERYDEGERLLRSLAPGTGERALRHFLLGNFAVKRNDAEAAAEEFERSLACDPTFAPAHNNLGVIAAVQGRRQPSKDYFTTAAGLRPGYADPLRNLRALQQGRLVDLRHTFAPLRSVLRPA